MDIQIAAWTDFVRDRQQQWQRLFDTDGRAPDQGPDWARCLVASREIDPASVHVAFAESQSGLDFALPYCVEAAAVFGRSARILRPLQSHHCLHNRFLARLPADRIIVPLIHALGERHRWHVLQIEKLVDGDATADAWLAAAATLGLGTDRTAAERPPYLRIESGWEDFLMSKSSNFRYNLKRKRKALEKQGSVDIETITSSKNFAAIFSAIIDIENRSWKQAAGSAITSRPWEQRFYQSVLPLLLDAGQLQIMLLSVDDKPVAHDISAVHRAQGYSLKTSYDESFDKTSPGAVLRPVLLEQLFNSGIVEYDFLGSSEPYKQQWGSGARNEFHVSILNNNLLGRAIDWRRRLRRALSRH